MNIDLNQILNRENEVMKIKNTLKNFESNRSDLTVKKGIYVYGDPGTGKTTFVMNILKELNYDVIKYDAGDIRNKSIIDTITKHNMSDKNVLSLFYKRVQHLAIIMDEIDGMNSGDKGGINSLIKIVRPKKTKKQKLEEVTMNPIICIGNYHVDKKIKELMKVCEVVELKTPTKEQIKTLIEKTMPALDENLKTNIIQFIQGDLRKFRTVFELYKSKQSLLNNDIIKNVFLMKSYNDDTRQITKKLINNYHSMEEHLTIMNETDRTIVGLLWHENIIDVIEKYPRCETVPLYLKVLDNMCFADYIDRITFQKQIWQLNEMSSLIKTFKNNKLYHEFINAKNKKPKFNPSEVRFTKVLTKYSTEFNNSVFIQNLCQQLGMDKKDMFTFFLDIKKKHSDAELVDLFENCDVSKLDINRIYRYLDKYIKEDAVNSDDDSVTSDIGDMKMDVTNY
jgi:DNA polymerase III delta prime subunit